MTPNIEIAWDNYFWYSDNEWANRSKWDRLKYTYFLLEYHPIKSESHHVGCCSQIETGMRLVALHEKWYPSRWAYISAWLRCLINQ